MTASPPSQIISVSDLGWQEFQPGISFKILWQDSATKRRAQMTRFAPGAQLPLHRHVGDELIFVIEGAVSDESGTVMAGNGGYRPNGCVHTVTSKNGATVLAVLTGDIEPVTTRGDAPPSQIFTLSDVPWVDARPGVRQKRFWEDKATERRRSMLTCDRVHAAVRAVVHLTGRHHARFVRIRALDEEDQLVPHVTVCGKRRPGLGTSACARGHRAAINPSGRIVARGRQ